MCILGDHQVETVSPWSQTEQDGLRKPNGKLWHDGRFVHPLPSPGDSRFRPGHNAVLAHTLSQLKIPEVFLVYFNLTRIS